MTEQEEREAFDAAADKLLLSGNAREIGWQAWQARASLAQPVVMEVCGGGWATGGVSPPAPVGVDASCIEALQAVIRDIGGRVHSRAAIAAVEKCRAALSAAGITDTSEEG